MIGLMEYIADASPDKKWHKEANAVFFEISRQRIFSDLRKQNQAAQKEEQLHDKRRKNTKGQLNGEMGGIIERNRVAKNDHNNPQTL